MEFAHVPNGSLAGRAMAKCKLIWPVRVFSLPNCVLQPTQPFDVILGMNFLADNGLELFLKPAATGFNGTLVD